MKKERFPLTKSQLAIWLGQQLYPDVPLYNMVHLFRLESEIDIDLFKKAFQLLVNNVEVLRIVFELEDGEPVQRILPVYDYDLSLEVFSEAEWKNIQQDWIDRRSKKLLPLDQPLFDSVLIQVGSEHFYWYLNIHHLATDATSSTLYLEYLSEIYMGLGENPQFQALQIPSYKSFADFEAAQVEKHMHSEARSYWNSKLDAGLAPISLYGRQNAQHTTASERITITLDNERVKAIDEVLSEKEFQTWNRPLTEFIFYTTLLFAFLFKISNEKKLAIGAPTHNRSQPDFKRTPGMFIEIFPIVGEFQPDDTFLMLYQRVRKETFEYLKNAQTGLASPEISGSFQIMINYIHSNFGTFNGAEVASQWIHPDHIDPAHLLRCSIYAMDQKSNTQLLFDLNNAAFDSDLRQLFPAHYLNLLDQILENVNQPLAEMNILSEKEMSWMTAQSSFKSSENSILSEIKSTCQNFAERPALRSDNKILSYAELDLLSDQLAGILWEDGVRPANTLGLYFPRSSEYIIALLAAMKIGAIFIPLAANQSDHRINYMISDSDCRHLLSFGEISGNIDDESVKKHIVDLSVLKNSQLRSFEQEVKLQPSDIAYILYTSGSTGRPKGVQISHGALINYLGWAKEYYGLDEPFVFPFYTSIGFDLTLTSIFLPLMTGGELIIYHEAKSGPDLAILDVLDDNQVNSIKLTPSHLALAETKDLVDSRLQLIIAGGEELTTIRAQRILNQFAKIPRLVNEYGPTEATIGCVVHDFDINRKYGTTVPIGKAIKNMSVFVLDQNQNLLPQGVPGELYLSGLSLAQDYLNHPEKTGEHFLANPFHSGQMMYKTGDWVRWNVNKELEFLGRKDEQIKFHGYRIELSDIEMNLVELKEIEQVAVMLMDIGEKLSDHEESGEDNRQLVAFFTSLHEVKPEQLKAELLKKLPEYMVPTRYIHLESIPLTSNGKLDRDQLSKIELTDSDKDKTSLQPRNDIEEMIFQIWKDVLGDVRFGVEDSFISLGGHSLTAIRITTRINEELGLQFPLIKIFELPTIANYAHYVEQTLVELMDN